MGRDSFCDLLRANGLMLRKRRVRPRTTDSRHNYFKYEDLLNTEPKLVARRAGELVVADITYIACENEFAYLSLLTDAYSRCIVGYCLHRTLETEGCLKALSRALDFYRHHQIDITQMIHHSDRGVQYASKSYIDLLRENGCRISMTQTGDPLHNALAERMNNTIKNSWYVSSSEQSFEQAEQAIERAVAMYNQARPHQALGSKTPLQMIHTQAPNPSLEGKEELITMAPQLSRTWRAKQKANFVKCQLQPFVK